MYEKNNREDCKWIELFMNAFGDKVVKCICHLKPESKKVDSRVDCQKCPFYVRNDEEDE